jgi:putative ABC transport system substrate-binding protein
MPGVQYATPLMAQSVVQPKSRQMRRRELIASVGVAAVMWPLAPRAQQQSGMPVVGFLGAASPSENAPFTAEFLHGLNEAGFIEGRNVVIEYRWAEAHYDRLPMLAADLVRQRVAVIFTSGGRPPLQAAMAATSTIPIVFSLGGDPVGEGFVASLNRPGGNVTGVNFLSDQLVAKRFELMRELVPRATMTALLVNPDSPASEIERRLIEAMARAVRHDILVVNARSPDDIETAFARLVEGRANELLVTTDAFLLRQRGQIADLAMRHGIPAVAFEREFVASGALMSYSTPLRDSYHQAGVYAGRILKGAKPADLPVVQATRYELILNLKTAKALGLTIPPSLLARADEVIE